MVDNRCLVYQRIWKCGNNAIRAHLSSLPGLMTPGSNIHALVESRKRGADSSSSVSELISPSSPLCTAGYISFTFVREPLQHFLSGFTEWMIRSKEYRDRMIDKGDAKQVLGWLLQGRMPPRSSKGGLGHIFLMSGIFHSGQRNFDFIGRLEHASKDWATLVKLSGMPVLAHVDMGTNSKVGTHRSSSDPQGAKAAMSAVLRGNPDLRRGLCQLLLPDYEVPAVTVKAMGTAPECPSPI